MQIMIAGGTGFIGRHLVNALLKKGYKITVLGRSENKIKTIFLTSVNAITWEIFEKNKNTFLKQQDAIINFVGENIGRKYWTERVKQTIKSSRVHTSQTLVNACMALPPEKRPRFFNASAVGIYGLSENNPDQPNVLDESWQIPWGKPTDFLSEVGQAWEAVFADSFYEGYYHAFWCGSWKEWGNA